MIFVTVGTQLPFDRLIRTIDNAVYGRSLSVIAQIGAGSYIPKNMDWRRDFSAPDYDRVVTDCELMVSHAGVGSILTAQRKSKPIVLFPRRHNMAEHRNDHQQATCDYLQGTDGIYVASTEEELVAYLWRLPLVPASRAAHDDKTRGLTSNLAAYLADIAKATRSE
jgi:UDP-N-acetylglucosamine transferase subunit ALG13